MQLPIYKTNRFSYLREKTDNNFYNYYYFGDTDQILHFICYKKQKYISITKEDVAT